MPPRRQRRQPEFTEEKRHASVDSDASSDSSSEENFKPKTVSRFQAFCESDSDEDSDASSNSSSDSSNRSGQVSSANSIAKAADVVLEKRHAITKSADTAHPETKPAAETSSSSSVASDSRVPVKAVAVPPASKQQITVPSAPKRAAAAKKEAKKKPDDDIDLDQLLSEVKKPMTKSKAPPASKDVSVTAASPSQLAVPPESAVVPAESPTAVAEKDGTEGTTVSAKTLKNRLKKLKKKQAAEGGEDAIKDKGAATTQGSKTAVAPKKAAPLSAAARLAQQRLLLVQAEQKKLEEQARQQEELEAKRRAEEEEQERKANEEKERKRLARLAAKECLRREGKPVTAAEKERARRAEQARLLLLQQMDVSPDALLQATSTETGKKSRVVVNKKKKRNVVTKAQAVAEEENAVTEPSPVEPLPQEPVASESLPVMAKEDTEPCHPRTWEDLSDWEKSDSEESPAVSAEKHESSPTSLRRPASAEPTSSVPLNSCAEADDKDQRNVSSSEFNKAEKTDGVARKPLQKEATTLDNGSSRKNLDVAELRSPICCILGHVDTGKTKLLDKIRRTDVQAGEAGGITQQIGATFFPSDALWEQCKKVDEDFKMRVPGLLIIDTPGHESFNNLRARGSSLCDIAILVVDIMHGLEPQTRESIELLRARKCPFIIALNKIDRLYGWVACTWGPSQASLGKQKESTQYEFSKRCSETLLQLAEVGLNCALWWEAEDVKKTVSIAPTSAITGEGIPDLLYLLVKLTQNVITRALVFKEEFQCTILEVKTIEGLGTTIDVVLVSGTLFDNDKIVVCGMSGPIVANIRALLTPQPLKELRVKGDYVHHKQIRAAMGVKICAQGLEEAVAGTSLLVARGADEQELERLQEDVMADIQSIFQNVDRSGIGVYVMASTLGSLEALLQFLSTSKIPVFAVNIGPVHKLDVKKASVMREKGVPEYSCILAFDVKVDAEATKEAQALGVKIFTADIIYHLFDSFNQYVAEIAEAKRKEKQTEVVFPCILSIYPNCIFNKKDPIVLGVKVEEGIVKVGTPLCIPEKEKFFVGRIASVEHNKKPVEQARRGDDIAIKILGDSNIMFGRHFDHTTKLYSRITRDSIDCLKEFFRDDLKKEDWKLVMKMKKILDIA